MSKVIYNEPEYEQQATLSTVFSQILAGTVHNFYC
jgi:hypothetical protein